MFFDPVSKTIKSQNWKSWSLAINNANSLVIEGTNSKWNQLFTWKAPYLANEKETNKVA
jgi:hypothetical protein